MYLTNAAKRTSMKDDDVSPTTTTATRIGMGSSLANPLTKDAPKKDADPHHQQQQQQQQEESNATTEVEDAKAQVELATVRAQAAKAQVQVAVAEAKAAQAKVEVAQRQEQEAQVLLEQAKAKLNAIMPQQQAPPTVPSNDSGGSLEHPSTEAVSFHHDPASENSTRQMPLKDLPIEGTKGGNPIEEADCQQKLGSVSTPFPTPSFFHPPKQLHPNPTTLMTSTTTRQAHPPPHQRMPILHQPFVPTDNPFYNQQQFLMGQQQQFHQQQNQQQLQQQQQEAMAIPQKYHLLGIENNNSNKRLGSRDATTTFTTTSNSTSSTTTNSRTTRTLIYSGPPDDDMSDVGGWPSGWTKNVFQRHDKRKDKYWYSPLGMYFNSLVKVRDFLSSEEGRRRVSAPPHHNKQQRKQQQLQLSQRPQDSSQPILQQQQAKSSLQNPQQQSQLPQSNYDQPDQDDRQERQHQPQQQQEKTGKTADEDGNPCNAALQQKAKITDNSPRQEAEIQRGTNDRRGATAQNMGAEETEDPRKIAMSPSQPNQQEDDTREQSQSQSRNDNVNLAGVSAAIATDLALLADDRKPHMTALQADIHGDRDAALKQPTALTINPLEETVEQPPKGSSKGPLEVSPRVDPQNSLEKLPDGSSNKNALPDTIIKIERDKWGSRDMRLIEKIRDFLLERWTLGQAEVGIRYVVEAVGYATFAGRLKKAIAFLVDRGLLEQPSGVSVKLTDEGFKSASKMKEHSVDGRDATARTNSRQINIIHQEYLTVQGPGTYEKKRELNSVHAFTAGDAGPNTCPILNWGKQAIQKRPKLHEQSLNIAGKRTKYKINEPAPTPNEVTSQSRADDTTTDVGRSLDIGHSTENHKHDTTKLVIANFIAKIQVFLYRMQEKGNSKVSELHIIDGIGVKDRDYALFTKALDALRGMGHVEAHCHDIQLTREGVQTIAALFRRRSTRTAKETKTKAVFASRVENGPPVPEETVSGSTLQKSSSDIQPDVIKLPNENTAEDTNASPSSTMLPRYDIDSDDDQTSIDSDTEMARLINRNLTQHWTDKTDAVTTNLEKQCLSKQEVLNFCQTLKIQEKQPTKTAITNIFDLLSDGECHSKQELLDVSGYSYSEVCQFQATIQLLEKQNIIQHTGKKCYQMTDQMFPCGRFNTAAAGNHEEDIEIISECI